MIVITKAMAKALQHEAELLSRKYNLPLLLITPPEDEEQLKRLMAFLFQKMKEHKTGIVVPA